MSDTDVWCAKCRGYFDGFAFARCPCVEPVGGAAPSAPTTESVRVTRCQAADAVACLARETCDCPSAPTTDAPTDDLSDDVLTDAEWRAHAIMAGRAHPLLFRREVHRILARARGGATAPTPGPTKVEGVVRRVEEAAGAARQLAEMAQSLAQDLTNTEALARVRLRRDTGASHE